MMPKCDRCGECTWPAACGSFDEAFKKISDELREDLERMQKESEKLPLVGFSAWIPKE